MLQEIEKLRMMDNAKVERNNKKNPKAMKIRK